MSHSTKLISSKERLWKAVNTQSLVAWGTSKDGSDRLDLAGTGRCSISVPTLLLAIIYIHDCGLFKAPFRLPFPV